ncbi:MAG: VOC family protein [Candidatus Acidiferrales bacterium]
MNHIAVKRITPVLLVDEVEPCVEFWEQLGFEKTSEVPDGNKLAFVALRKGNVEMMYQTYASVEKDPDALKSFSKGPTFLYVEVENLDDVIAIIAAMKGVEVVMPVRTTFYGAKEVGAKDPGGHVVTFAQFGAAAQH